MKTKEEILVKTLEISESMLMEDIVSIWSDELKAMEEYKNQECAAKDKIVDDLLNQLDDAKQEIERLKEEIHKLKFPRDYPKMW